MITVRQTAGGAVNHNRARAMPESQLKKLTRRPIRPFLAMIMV
jgi:hypothetical protein